MAKRRMFTLDIIDSDAFLEMPLSAQALYFHLGMRADDDGFVSNPRRVKALVGAADDDLKILLAKRFLLAFDSGIVVIKHWRLHNYVRGDRYKKTLYLEEKRRLYIKKNGVYTDHPLPAEEALPPGEPEDEENPGMSSGIPNDIPSDIPAVATGKVREGKGRLGQDSIYSFSGGGDTRTHARARARTAILEYLQGRQLDPNVFFGVTDETLDEVELFTESLFQTFTTRKPTPVDAAKVFLSVREQTCSDDGETWTVTMPEERKKLLMYAFETAASAGKPGEWNYINGILSRMARRGITTLGAAEDYDIDKEGGA